MSDPMPPKTDSAAFAEAWDAPQKSALAQAEIDRMTDDIIEALKSVFDPEIPVDIYDLGPFPYKQLTPPKNREG